MVFARSRMADSLLSRQVQAHTFEKDYLAVLEGVPAQASGVLEDQLRRDTAARRTCVADAPGPDTRPARLSYRVLGEDYKRIDIPEQLDPRLHTLYRKKSFYVEHSDGLELKIGRPEYAQRIAQGLLLLKPLYELMMTE